MEFNATFIVAFISFIIFTIIMNIILYKPINDIVQKRKKYIDDNYSEAKKNRDESEKILQERQEALNKAKTDAREKLEKEINLANAKKEELKAQAKAQAKEQAQAQREEDKNAKQIAQESLKGEVVGLAQMISDKLLGANEQINAPDMELISKIMQE